MANYYEDGAQQGAGTPRRGMRRGFKRFWITLGILAAAGAVLALIWAVRLAVAQHVDVLFVEGTIQNTSTGLFDAGYDHGFLLDAVDDLTYDPTNQALVLYIDSPGGGVYETDELYLKLMDYREQTGRPIYACFGSMAASGGYYLAMAADKITANRNCVTGSIGVRLGAITDMSGLMEKLGIKVETITAGKNKAMGDSYAPLTDEQRQIYQSYVDESYEQFVSIVDAGRENLSLEQVRALADGRIYTARQALDNGLIDELGTLDDAIAAVQEDYGLYDCDVRYVTKSDIYGFWGGLFSALEGLRPKNAVESAVEAVEAVRGVGGYYCDTLPPQ